MKSIYSHIVSLYLFCGVVLLVLVTNCTHGQLYNDALGERLADVETDVPFSLDSLLTDQVDVLYVAKPYQYKELEKHEINIPKKLRKTFEKITLYDEDKYILLLVKGDRLVGYTIVHNVLMDFSGLDKRHEGIPVGTPLVVDSLRKVNYYGNN